MGKIIKRKLYVNKKTLYRQIAQLRKAKWAQKYQLQHEEQFKFHFCESQEYSNNDHLTKNLKNDHKSDQRVKNRLAAQESREKRKNYLEELQRKLELYEELLETQTCRQCHGILKDKSDTQFDVSQQKMSLKEKQMGVEDYFEEGVIRVDNQGISTPFAIFFFLCFIVVLTIFTYHTNQSIDQRLLSNYDSLHLQSYQKQSEERFVKSTLKINKPLSYFEIAPKNLLNSHYLTQNNAESKKDAEINSDNQTGWRKYGNLMCTKSDKASLKQKGSSNSFLMLRTAADDSNEKQNNIQQQEWGKGEVLTCIVSG